MKRVLVALSGGVDSAVAAALLVEQGYECIGATMQLWSAGLSDTGSCALASAVEDARRVAATLGIPHHVFDVSDEFRRVVVDRFADAYVAGITPNPCVICNSQIKLGALAARAASLGCHYVATGHYARIWFDQHRQRWCLAKGRDSAKDQSYVLYALTQEQLGRTLLPLGDYSKDQTRALALGRNLQVAEKAESQEICFIPDGKYQAFLRRYRPESRQPGPIEDRQGRILGRHEGLAFYTIGQRRGLGVAAARPLYVVDLDPHRNAVVVGETADVHSQRLTARSVNWVSMGELAGPLRVMARIRYRMKPGAAVIEPLPGGRVLTRFTLPQRAITPGQSVVWYQGDLVLGGGIIERQATGAEVDT